MPNIFSEIQYVLNFNKVRFDESGYRFYYSIPKLCFSLLLDLFLFTSGVMLLINFGLYIGWICIAIVLFGLALDSMLTDTLPKMFFKNPVFIIKDDDLYYTKDDQHYDLKTCSILLYRNPSAGALTFGWLRIKRRNEADYNQEYLWDLKSASTLKKCICEVKEISHLPCNSNLDKEYLRDWI